MMQKIDLTPDELVRTALLQTETGVCVLDSCGVGHQESHLLIAGLHPVTIYEPSVETADEQLPILDEIVNGEDAAIFALSYDFGLQLQGIEPCHPQRREPFLYAAIFDSLRMHDYKSGQTYYLGNPKKLISSDVHASEPLTVDRSSTSQLTSDFSRDGSWPRM
ncbi:MAG: hypothetical protein LC734_01665 [Acidobacteria bacterium]|nr:hypothetical protein [Acidobacteriota bacterium]